jgi:hypothetical protein
VAAQRGGDRRIVPTSLELQVQSPSGLHARPAAVFVRAACSFESDIRVANLTTGSNGSALGDLQGLARRALEATSAGEARSLAEGVIRTARGARLDAAGDPVTGAVSGPAPRA